MSAWPQPFTSTVSHWQASNKGSTSLWNHGRDDPLPEDKVDIVIIGAGMTGASLAYQLTRPGAAGEGKSILLLEAKDVASGATGRNGGHFAPYTSNAFPALIRPLSEGGAGLSPADALHVIRSERDNFDLAREICEKEGLAEKVDLWCGEICEVHENEEWKSARRDARKQWLAALAEHGYETDTESRWIEDPEEAKKVSRSPVAIGAHFRRAGSVHPHKLCTALLRLALDPATSSAASFRLQSWTPVKSLKPLGAGTGEEGWEVETIGDKGTVKAGRVVLCSNAHTAHLFGEGDEGGKAITEHITPVRGHACLITPPPSFSGATGALKYTMAWDDPYLATNKDAGYVVGIGWGTGVAKCGEKKEAFLGCTDDGVVLPGVKTYLEGVMKVKLAWGEEAPGEGLTRIWSGIMAYSRDILPLIGPVPSKPNFFAAVAFHGHGMSRILACTRSLAAQMGSPQLEWDERLPRSFEITRDRFERAKKARPVGSEAGGAEKEATIGVAEEGGAGVRD